MLKNRSLVFLMIIILVAGFQAMAATIPTSLTCEYKTNPLGIDTPNPRLSWIIESTERGQIQTACQILVSSTPENLDKNNGDLWDSGKILSSNSLSVVYEGKKLQSSKRYYWKVRVWDKNQHVSQWSSPAWWETALLNPNDWHASWINDGKSDPQQLEDFYKNDPAPLFRTEFKAAKEIKMARLYISGLGYYKAFLNGQLIGDFQLDPGWTTYSKRVLYSTYDVTPLLEQGDNAMGVMLGNGWYNPLPMRMWGRYNLRENLTIGRPSFIARLQVEYVDGSIETIVSDKNWKVTEGPILRNNVYLGEIYDARKEIPGWNKAGFNDSKWRQAEKTKGPIGTLTCQSAPPIRITAKIKPIAITEPKPDVYIFDMGQNFAGWVKLKVKGPAGTKVKLRYGELLYPDSLQFHDKVGTRWEAPDIYPGALNLMTTCSGQIKPNNAKPGPGAPDFAYQSDTYILKGDGEEEYIPSFTFRGFRYVEVTGYPGKPSLETIEGLRLNSDVKSVGSFSCSNELFNRIQKMVRWTMLSNLFSVQSDCPAREKFGYGGDIVGSCEAFMYNFDMSTFYEKAIHDFSDALRPNGGLTETAPYIGIAAEGFGEGTGPIGWTIAHPLLQQQLYRYYGNKRMMQEQQELNKSWIDFLRTQIPNDTIGYGIGDHESLDPKPTPVTSTSFYYHNALLVSELEQLLGNQKSAKKYNDLAQQVKKTFLATFLKSGTGQVYTGTQACQAFALYLDLLPESERKAAADSLLSQILDHHNGHVSTGIFATKYVLNVLTQIGRADVAFKMVNQKTFPGWGYMLENGATTLWEHWAFSDYVYSHNHPMFGMVSEWFFKALAGINFDPESQGFDKIIISPNIVGDLTWAKGEYESIRGKIVSSWGISQDKLYLDVTIPANTTATVVIPTPDANSITENGVPVVQVEGVTLLKMEDNKCFFKVGSGDYRFSAMMPPK